MVMMIRMLTTRRWQRRQSHLSSTCMFPLHYPMPRIIMIVTVATPTMWRYDTAAAVANNKRYNQQQQQQITIIITIIIIIIILQRMTIAEYLHHKMQQQQLQSGRLPFSFHRTNMRGNDGRRIKVLTFIIF